MNGEHGSQVNPVRVTNELREHLNKFAQTVSDVKAQVEAFGKEVERMLLEVFPPPEPLEVRLAQIFAEGERNVGRIVKRAHLRLDALGLHINTKCEQITLERERRLEAFRYKLARGTVTGAVLKLQKNSVYGEHAFPSPMLKGEFEAQQRQFIGRAVRDNRTRYGERVKSDWEAPDPDQYMLQVWGGGGGPAMQPGEVATGGPGVRGACTIRINKKGNIVGAAGAEAFLEALHSKQVEDERDTVEALARTRVVK